MANHLISPVRVRHSDKKSETTWGTFRLVNNTLLCWEDAMPREGRDALHTPAPAHLFHLAGSELFIIKL